MRMNLEQQLSSIPALHSAIVHKGVLVVDDNELQRLVSAELLRSMGITRIYEAANGLDALQLLHNETVEPAVILVDLHMPRMDGIELIQAIAKLKLKTSIIILSGADSMLLDTLGSMVRACKLPMLGALPKPINGQALLRSLQRYHFIQQSQPEPEPGISASPSALDVQRAIRLGQIKPFYQPKVSLKHAQVVGFEALARWCDPAKEIVLPNEFIDVATDHGLLKELTLCMLDAILADMKAWNSLDIFPIISLNIAVTLLEEPTFANQIIRRVQHARIPAAKILLEITESALMKNQAIALGSIGRLKLNGFNFSIDDYGTGFSSMQQLSRIAFSELKIDRSFVCRVGESTHLANIVHSALDIGQRLGLTTVAEGVETLEELKVLREMGCDEIQGYLFARPMPACDVMPWLNDNAANLSLLCHGEP